MKLELKNLSVNLSGKEILKNINLKIKDGEFISLLGASGCGKTTLLKSIAGIVEKSSGNILLNGNPIDNLPPHKRNTVIVFQDFRLFPHMTVSENISFPLKMSGLSKSKCREHSIQLLDRVKLRGFEDKKINEISGGQMQRVALARALAADPSVLLLDEPFSSLDINLRKDMRELVLDLQKDFGITTILVTHDKEEALTMSDRIAFMHDGEILQYDKPEEIFNKPSTTIIANYFHDGIYVDGEVKSNCFNNAYFNAKVNMPDGLYKCLLRPSAINISPDENGLYEIVDKIYRGDRYLLRLKNIKNNLKLETEVDDSISIDKNDRVSISIEKNRLIYLPK